MGSNANMVIKHLAGPMAITLYCKKIPLPPLSKRDKTLLQTLHNFVCSQKCVSIKGICTIQAAKQRK